MARGNRAKGESWRILSPGSLGIRLTRSSIVHLTSRGYAGYERGEDAFFRNDAGSRDDAWGGYTGAGTLNSVESSLTGRKFV